MAGLDEERKVNGKFFGGKVSLTLLFMVLLGSGFATRPAHAVPTDLQARSYERRAVEAAIWGMPMVNFDAMRQAYFRDAQAQYNDVLYWSRPSDWRNQTTTPNHSTQYVMFFANLKDGPVVVDVPPARETAFYGSLLDAWNTPLINVGNLGQDQGRGGRYLLLPPGFEGQVPKGCIPVKSATYNVYSLLRVITRNLEPVELEKGVGYLRSLKVYALHEGDRPGRFIDMVGRMFDAIPPFDHRFYQSLARMIEEEPVQERDLVDMGRLRTLSIGKNQAFGVTAQQRLLLDRAGQEAHDFLMEGFAEAGVPFWGDQRHWKTILDPKVALGTQLRFIEPGKDLRLDDRGFLFYAAYAPPVPNTKTPPVVYVKTHRSADGQLLEGGLRYRLHIPANVPAGQFWAVDVYDAQSAGFIRQAKVIGVDSHTQGLKHNADGSVDLEFASMPSAAPTSANWISTEKGKRFFVLFRVYGPQAAMLERRWLLEDLQLQP